MKNEKKFAKIEPRTRESVSLETPNAALKITYAAYKQKRAGQVRKHLDGARGTFGSVYKLIRALAPASGCLPRKRERGEKLKGRPERGCTASDAKCAHSPLQADSSRPRRRRKKEAGHRLHSRVNGWSPLFKKRTWRHVSFFCRTLSNDQERERERMLQTSAHRK